ncbi:MAG: penicillin-binding transpeptidase domain-containing protein [Patescibacteria group bacterium]
MRLSSFFKRRQRYSPVEPDEIFIDSENLPQFDTMQLEGRIAPPLPAHTYRNFLILVSILLIAALAQAINLMVVQHEAFAARAEENRLTRHEVPATRGRIIDRLGVVLAENMTTTTATTTNTQRSYPLGAAGAHLIGYVSYPKRDAQGVLYQSSVEGVQGIEAAYDEVLAGTPGRAVSETNALGATLSGTIVTPSLAGRDVVLSIDSDLQQEMYRVLEERVRGGFRGGTGGIIDIQNGELLALASYPAFDPEVMSRGAPAEEVAAYQNDTRSPFLDRAVSGVYTPGSIIKPFVALAALMERVVTPTTTFVSTGKLVVPNPYDPESPSIFRDWRAHGAVDMRRALAVSSDVYFYIVGGGFEDQRGLGITRLDQYASLFGFGSTTGYSALEAKGTVPSPAWKTELFEGDEWRVGDTYNTSIGQFGWQVTLLQVLRATAALANGGDLITPTLLRNTPGESISLNLPREDVRVVHEGMRAAVNAGGTAASLNNPSLSVAGKTGTAEVGVLKENINSLVIGFFPYDAPRYAFAVILEKSKAGNTNGAPAAMREIIQWIVDNRPLMRNPQAKLTQPAGTLQ